MAGLEEKDQQDMVLGAVMRGKGRAEAQSPQPQPAIWNPGPDWEQRIATLEDLVSELLRLSDRVQVLEHALAEIDAQAAGTANRLNGLAARTSLHLRQEHKIVVGANL